MKQTQLFDFSPHPRHRVTDPQTSVDAARTAKHVEAQILAVLQGEMTADQILEEITRRFGFVRQDTLRSALSRLKNGGQVRVAGVGRSNTGRQMQKVRVA